MADPADVGGGNRRRSLLLSGAAALVLAVVATALMLGDRFTCGGPGSGVREIQGECVGVTDGSFEFADEFEHVSGLIRAENERIDALAGGQSIVRVAFLGTLSFEEVGPMDPTRMRGALEGAYTAQIRANDTRAYGDPTPQIQLVLANMGGRQGSWEPVVEDLVAMAQDEDRPLVAVTGLGVSIESTKSVAEELHRYDIPMVSSAVTADGLAHGPEGIDDAGDEENPASPGVIRVAPSNNEYVKALRTYLEGLDEPARAVIVHDQTEPDLFVSTLKSAYDAHLSAYTEGRSVQTYRGTTVGDTPPAGLFSDVSGNVCATDADTILFAGRAPDLDAFLDSLRYSVCDRDMRVLFVSTGMSMLNQEEEMRIVEEQDITLVYATGVDPRWNDAPAGSPGVPEGYPAFRDAYLEHFGEQDPDLERLANGYALVNHDAVAVAAAALRMTNEQGNEPVAPKAEAVRDRLMLLNTRNSQVTAGGGTLSYSPEGAGEAIGRYVPIVELPFDADAEPKSEPHVIDGGESTP